MILLSCLFVVAVALLTTLLSAAVTFGGCLIGTLFVFGFGVLCRDTRLVTQSASLIVNLGGVFFPLAALSGIAAALYGWGWGTMTISIVLVSGCCGMYFGFRFWHRRNEPKHRGQTEERS